MKLHEIAVGDIVFRDLAGSVMALKVTAVTPEKIITERGYEFAVTTGGEIDTAIGFDGLRITGSLIVGHMSQAEFPDLIDNPDAIRQGIELIQTLRLGTAN